MRFKNIYIAKDIKCNKALLFNQDYRLHLTLFKKKRNKLIQRKFALIASLKPISGFTSKLPEALTDKLENLKLLNLNKVMLLPQ